MNMAKRQLDNPLRFERKYVLESNKNWIFKDILLKKNFSSIYSKRKVVSMYFDTIDFKFFRENIEGVGQRLKSRLRWYKNKDSEELEIKTFLEIKKKKGFVGEKIQYTFEKFLSENEIIKSSKEFKFQNKISNILKRQVFPVLITSYDREYYLNKNRTFRATVDTNLEILSLTANHFKIPISKNILEIKYETQHDHAFRNSIVKSNFNLRFQKFSKYVVGLLQLKKNGLI